MSEQQYSILYNRLRKLLIKDERLASVPERLEKTGNPEPMLYAFVFIMIIPAIAAIVLTLLETYPATIGINWMRDSDGAYYVKAAMMVNIVLFMVTAFVVALPVLVIYRLGRGKQ